METFDFGGRSATLYGDNAVGKTTVYDALTWLLFGKDSRGQKDFDIKPLDEDGNVKDHAAITSVDAELIVNGTLMRLKRTYFEKWSTKRGSSDKTFDGNSSDFFVDGVPCKKNEYDRRVEEIVPEEQFRLLTSVNCFAEDISWQNRREVLFRLAGIHSDRDIMGTREDFAPLLEVMGGNSLEDFKKRLIAERKGLNTRRTDIPARIAENQDRIQALMALDFGSQEAMERDLMAKLSRVQEDLQMAQSDQLLASAKVELGSLKNKLREVELENATFRNAQATPATDMEHLRRQLQQQEFNLDFYTKRMAALDQQIKIYERRVDQCRKDWSEYSNRVFHGATCSACGQALVGVALEKARSAFEAEKEKGKEDAIKDSNRSKEAIEQARTEWAEQSQMAENARQEIAEMKTKLQTMTAQDKAVEDMAGFTDRIRAIHEDIDRVNDQIFTMETDMAQRTAQLRAEAMDLENQLRTVRSVLAKKALMSDLTGRVEQLRQEAHTASDAMNSVDKMLWLLDEYTRYKVSFLEDTVNSLFSMAKFRLYKEQMNGGVEDRCDVTYLGVPYSSLNNGARINVGLDIIRTLSREYGICVPLFIDNAESVTHLERTDGQVIRLVVSEDDKKLRCEYEN